MSDRLRAAPSPSALHPTILPEWVRGLLPTWLKAPVREALCRAMDACDAARAARDPLIPPARLRVRVGCFASYIWRERYRTVGEEFAGHLRDIAGLVQDSRMLDIGCGCGQLATALATRLGPTGSYDGFDLDREAIAWCRAHIAARFANFRFAQADLANTLYNPMGGMRAEDISLPYADASFDVILLKSVFTHMPARQMQHYLAEIRRLLRPDGRCLVSYFLLNPESYAHIRAGESAHAFPHRGDGCWVFDPRVPDYVVAYEEQDVRAATAAAGLRVREPIHYGAWCGRRQFLSYQDLVVLIAERGSLGGHGG